MLLQSRSECTEGHESVKSERLMVLVEAIKDQWKDLWRYRIDDKVRAEGIADKDFSLLFVDRGTVIVATKDYKPLEFKEVLEQHGIANGERFRPPTREEGGYTKFAKTVLNKQKRAIKWKLKEQQEVKKKTNDKQQQQKKGGRGWLHYSLTK